MVLHTKHGIILRTDWLYIVYIFSLNGKIIIIFKERKMATMQKIGHYRVFILPTNWSIYILKVYINIKIRLLLTCCRWVVSIHLLWHFVGWHASITLKWLLHHLVGSIHFLHRCQHASITLQRLVFSFAQHNNNFMRYVPRRRTYPS